MSTLYIRNWLSPKQQARMCNEQAHEDERKALEKLASDFQQLDNQISYLKRLVAHIELEAVFHKNNCLRLTDYFTGIVDDHPIAVIQTRKHFYFQRSDDKTAAIDLFAKSQDGRVVMVAIEQGWDKITLNAVQRLCENALDYAQQYDVTALSAILSLPGFTQEAKDFCATNGIGIAEQIAYHQPMLEE